MTQTARREAGKPKQSKIGSLIVAAIILLLILARNYYLPTNEAQPTAESPTPVLSTTVEQTPQITPVRIATMKIAVGNDATQKSELPSLNASGAEPEKKQATRTPKPRPTTTPTRISQPTASKVFATATPTAQRARPTATVTRVVARSQSGLLLIYYDELPDEAQATIRLIDDDGPFPYSRDGIEFQNRERILPRKPRGYYSEYTVITPGSDDRGARRMIAGENGELYYTDDHYDSFKEVVR